MNKEKDFTTKNQHITIWGLLRQHILGKKLIAIIFCLALTSGITFIRPLVVKGITDEGMLKANMTMIVVFALFLLVCTLIEQTVNIIQSRQFAIIQNSAMLSLYQAVLPIFIKYALHESGWISCNRGGDMIHLVSGR